MVPIASSWMVALQLCRPLSGAVRRAVGGLAITAVVSFNCAAPFRGRLVQIDEPEAFVEVGLQLCRPLSGAVSSVVLGDAVPAAASFNCAAPFRGRLAGRA